MKNMTVWALFDSGNGSYLKGIKALNEGGQTAIDVYPIGLDIENKNSHFINLDLADYKRMFKDNTLFNKLDELPKPDLIIASPPCESWSLMSGMKNGNASWKQEDLSDSLFKPQAPPSKFTIRNKRDYEGYQFKYERSFLNRVNGELTVFNTIEIIKRYEPKYFVIENPAYSKMWDYITDIIGFELPFKNFTKYNNYDYPLQKPTRFSSNIDLNLKNETIKPDINIRKMHGYNNRSNIPQKLVKEIFLKVYQDFTKEEEQNGL